MNDINLLKNGQKKILPQQVIVKKVTIISFVFLSFVILIALALMGLRLSSKVPDLEQEESRLLSQIQANQETAVKLFLTKEKVKGINTILNGRLNLYEKLSAAMDKADASIHFDSLHVDTKNFNFTISSTSLTSLSKYFDTLVDYAIKQKKYKQVLLKDLSLDTLHNKYSATLIMVYL